jgi:hypothetical protein
MEKTFFQKFEIRAVKTLSSELIFHPHIKEDHTRVLSGMNSAF